MSKKRDDLEAIAKRLREWCEQYGESYASMAYLNGVAMAGISTDRPDYEECDLRLTYEKDPHSGNCGRSK